MKSLFGVEPSFKTIKPITMGAIKNIEPATFSVAPPADVKPRDEAMQRKASVMHAINVNDVYEFMEKMAAEDRKKVEPASHYPWKGEGYGNKMKMESAVKKMGPNEKWKVDASRVNPVAAIGVNYRGDFIDIPSRVNTRGEGYGPLGAAEENERLMNTFPPLSGSREVPVNPAHYYYPFN